MLRVASPCMTAAVQKPAEAVGVCTRESSAVVRTATRAEVRAQNLPHRCSYCLIVDRMGRVLVQKRVAWKETYPSHYDPCPGGVMGPDETFEENAIRELEEEMGIVVGSPLSPAPLEELFDFFFEDASVRNWGRLFMVRFDGDKNDLRLQPDEVESVTWLDRPELLRLLATGPVSPDAAVACRRWLSDDASPPQPPPQQEQEQQQSTVPKPAPGAFHPGWVCAIKGGLIVGYRYARPSTPADRQRALDLGLTPMSQYSISQAAFDELSSEEQRSFERIAPPLDPAKLAIAAFVASLLLGSVGGILSTGRFLDGAINAPTQQLEPLADFSELPPLSPAEALVGLIFRPPSR